MTHFRATIVIILVALFCCTGCLFTVTTISVPASAALGNEFCITCDATFSGGQSGEAGVLIEIPDVIEFSRAYLVSPAGIHTVRRNSLLEQTVSKESGKTVIALTGKVDYVPLKEGSVRLLAYFKAKDAGTYPIKFIFGIPNLEGNRANWTTVAPENVYRFSSITDSTHTEYLKQLTIAKADLNGTVALSFSGERQYVSLPDTGLFAFPRTQDYTIEFWLQTTAKKCVVLSTKTDDYASYYPFEIWIEPNGELQITTADGVSKTTTESGAFISDGMWHHVAISYSSENSYLRLFVDAITRDSVKIQSQRSNVEKNPLFLGCRSTKMHFFKGIVDELRFWNASRGEEEIAFYQNAVLSGFEDNLYAFFSFEKSNQGLFESVNPLNDLQAIAYNSPKLVMSTAPLLAEVISFSAYLDDENENKVILTWESFEDNDVKAYEVEKRTERGKFRVYERTAPDSALGNHQMYRFTDNYNGKDVFYYRLRRVNKDGSVFYSEVYTIGAEAYYNFVLEDNKPDPFVSGTEIAFSLSEPAYVTITVYDIMGREVERIFSEKKGVGTYSVLFNGADKPAGMYFYKLKTNTGSQTKKMYLSK